MADARHFHRIGIGQAALHLDDLGVELGDQLGLAAEVGLDAPPDLRAWGNVARRSQREKVIVPTGRYAPRASGNCTPTMLYQRPEAS